MCQMKGKIKYLEEISKIKERIISHIDAAPDFLDKSISAFVAGQEFEEVHHFTYVKTGPLKFDGQYCTIQYGELVDDREPIIVRTLIRFHRKWPREFTILNSLEPHDNINKLLYYAFGYQKMCMHLIYEGYPTLKSIMSRFRDNESRMPLLYIKSYMYQLFRGLGYLHYNKICHRDISPENLLIDGEHHILKIANFRQSTILENGKGTYCCVGTSIYKSPEAILYSPRYYFSIDIWSAGCVLGELLNSNKPIIDGDNLNEVFLSIQNLIGSPTFEDLCVLGVPEDYQHCIVTKKVPSTLRRKLRVLDELGVDLIEKILVYSPSKRPTPLSLFKHKFFFKLRDPTNHYDDDTMPQELFYFSFKELDTQPDLEWISVNFS